MLLFILVHKIGDTLAQLTLRLLFNDLEFTNDEIALYDIGVGFWAYLIGIFIGGVALHAAGAEALGAAGAGADGRVELQLRDAGRGGPQQLGLAGAIGFENIASGFGGVVVVAYFSALCNLQFTASQYALISASASVVGRRAHRHHGRRASSNRWAS